MGECGCNSADNIIEVVSIGKLVLAVELCLGCPYCHTGIAMSLYLMTKDDAEMYGHEPTKEFEATDNGMLNFPIVDQIDLIDFLKKSKSSDPIGPNDDQYPTLIDWLHDNGRTMLTQAAIIRANKIREMKRSLEERAEGNPPR